MSSAQPSRPLTAASRQLLVVVAAHWESRAGRLQRFARAGVDGGWQPVGDALAVSLGRAGLAWGRGLHPPAAGAGPRKREGDGRSPAGVFAITTLFGDAESPLARTAKLPYLAASAALKAIDDPASAHYNRIVDLSSLARPDWTSCEDMLRAGGRYAIGAVVAHNADPPLPGAGSCIFLHVWECEGAPTAGCTAMPRTAMSDLAGWLDGAATPLLVQLPQAEYESKRAEWGLPLFVPKPVGTPCGEPGDMPLR